MGKMFSGKITELLKRKYHVNMAYSNGSRHNPDFKAYTLPVLELQKHTLSLNCPPHDLGKVIILASSYIVPVICLTEFLMYVHPFSLHSYPMRCSYYPHLTDKKTGATQKG